MSDTTVRKSTRVLVVSSIMGALVIVMGLTHIGFIPWFTGISLTIMHIPVIIAAILAGPLAGLITGAIFGLFSMIQAAVAPTGAFDPLFVNPILSVLPRLFIGPVAWLAWKAFRNKLAPLASLSAGIAGSLTNSVLVLGLANAVVPMSLLWTRALNAFRSSVGLETVAETAAAFFPLKTILTVFALNGLPEAALAAIITMLVILAYMKIVPGGGSKLSREAGAE